ncbi:MAG: YdcF family protein [Bacteroidetes bacterium]|nr:YdcF family protein [Bacteroidota bacterium]
MISLFFFGVPILIQLVLFFKKYPLNNGALFVLFFLSILSNVFVVTAFYFYQKDLKILLYSFALLLNFIVTSGSIVIITSRLKKLYVFRTIWFNLFLIPILLLVVFFKVYTFKDDAGEYADGEKKADAGVILGAAVWGGNRPSPVLRERINKGFEIYDRKNVRKLVLTGGGSPNEMTEGDVAKNELIKYGVDPKNLIVENNSNSTMEQLQFVRDFLYKTMNWKKIILISDNYHLFRCKQICSFNNISADAISSDTPLSTEGGVTFCIKESFALVEFWFFGIG